MTKASNGSLLSTVFVDYDNIYFSLKRKNEEAAKRFAKDASTWLNGLISGDLITPTNGPVLSTPRRIVMNRCYGNPVPRRNQQDNSTDMNSFPFVRHHYLRAGFEVIDCPPLTAQLKNSADIRMVMDVRDYLLHDTYFDEFIILSGDADFTPLLHRLRQHARRTVIYSNDYTAAPYTAISDGEIRESDLIALLTGQSASRNIDANEPKTKPSLPSPEMLASARQEIVSEVLSTVRSSPRPVPLEALADRAVRILGHDKTVGSAWGGAGSFRDLLAAALPEDVRLSDAAPYYVVDTKRQSAQQQAAHAAQSVPKLSIPADAQRSQPSPQPRTSAPSAPPPQASQQQSSHGPDASAPQRERPAPPPPQTAFVAPSQSPGPQQPSSGHPAAPPSQHGPGSATALQEAIARIHQACQAPPLSPPEYRALFDIIADEITTNGLTGARTLVSITERAQSMGIEISRDDARFILEVVSEADPWFENGASAALFASRFRNFVIARCRSQGLNLSATDLDLIDAWFSDRSANEGPGQIASDRASDAELSGGHDQQKIAPSASAAPQHRPEPQVIASQTVTMAPPVQSLLASQNREPDPFAAGSHSGVDAEDEMPRIVRNRARV